MFDERIKRLIKNLKDNEAYLITDRKNCFYFSGISSSNITLYITKSKRFLITDFRYAEASLKNTAGFKVLTEKSTLEYLKIISEEEKKEKVYTEFDKISVSFYDELRKTIKGEILPIGNNINNLRAVKDHYELECIKKSQEIADKAFLKMLESVKEGVSENELKAELEYQMALGGSEMPSFDTIVLFGSKTSLPHGTPTGQKLKSKDIILMDFGATYKGYASDNTRTFFFGTPDEKQKKAYDAVLNAHIATRDLIKIGMRGSEADKIARDLLDDCGYKNLFGHSLGHGVGLDIHENVRLSLKSDDILCENMVFSIEPGIYLENDFGIRTEDIYVLKKDGVHSLTTLTKDILII